MPSRYDQIVDPHRPNNAHAHALALIGFNRRVLELGAAAGHVTRVLVEQRCSVTAIEFEPEAAADLGGLADRVICGDLNDPAVFDELTAEYDVVLAGDVLEHLVRPHDVLCRAVRLLRPGGHVVISLPHVGHVDVRLALLRGEWKYRPWGLLDATHVRFFTLPTIKEMLADAGLTMTELRRVRMPAFESELDIARDSVSSELLDELLSDPEAETYQFVLSAEVARRAVSVDGLPERNAALQDRLERTEIAYGALRAEHAEMTAKLERVDEELAELETARRTLARIEGSVTWRYFQRARHGVFGALGGENSSGARAIQASLRRVGGGLRGTERTRSPVTGPAPHRPPGRRRTGPPGRRRTGSPGRPIDVDRTGATDDRRAERTGTRAGRVRPPRGRRARARARRLRIAREPRCRASGPGPATADVAHLLCAAMDPADRQTGRVGHVLLRRARSAHGRRPVGRHRDRPLRGSVERT